MAYGKVVSLVNSQQQSLRFGSTDQLGPVCVEFVVIPGSYQSTVLG